MPKSSCTWIIHICYSEHATAQQCMKWLGPYVELLLIFCEITIAEKAETRFQPNQERTEPKRAEPKSQMSQRQLKIARGTKSDAKSCEIAEPR